MLPLVFPWDKTEWETHNQVLAIHNVSIGCSYDIRQVDITACVLRKNAQTFGICSDFLCL